MRKSVSPQRRSQRFVDYYKTTERQAYVLSTAGQYFGCGGTLVLIDGIKPSRVSNSYCHRMPLERGESCTLFRTLTKPKRDGQVAYGTLPVGHYNARVWVFSQ